jgi:hypothetical protein
MKAVVEYCAGIDVGKRVLNVWVMAGAAEQEPWNCGSSSASMTVWNGCGNG